MGIAASCYFHSERQPAARRLELALAASALLHAVLGAGLAFEAGTAERRAAGFPPITVRIQQQAPASSFALPAPGLEPSPAAAPTRSRGRPAAGDSPQPVSAASIALPQAADSAYYSAHDLDAYPRPVAPLVLERFAAEPAARLRFSVAIDEVGLVREVAAIEAQPGERVRDEVRAMLAATRFIPARKDGRAVRSRVQLDVILGPQP